MFTIAKNAEAKLLEVANTLQEDSDGYYAIHFNFSTLQEGQRSDYQIKIAVNILQDLFKEEEGGVFVCQDNDVFFLYKGTNRALIEKAIFQLRYLFADDPLAYTVADRENEDFCTVYDLQFQCRDFIAHCKQKITTMATSERDKPTIAQSAQEILALTPRNLSQIEVELGKMDIKHAIRQQPICAVVEGKPIQPLFYEMYIHIAHLQRLMPVNINFLSNLSLFKYLTEILDAQVLSIIKQQPRFYFRESISLNLNIKSILSKSFAELTAALPDKTRNAIIIEISAADVFSNFNAFLTAHHFLKKYGYRTCLDGLNSQSFLQIDRKNLGFDITKLQWNADFEAQTHTHEDQTLSDAIQRCDPSRVILCHCDSKYAIDYGKALGISLFQGRHLDKILSPEAKMEN